MDESGDFKVDKPDYVTERTIELVGPKFWNKETRIIHLGSEGLRLTVVKSGQRQKIQYLDEAKKERNIQNDYEEGKVVLQAKFDKLLLVDKVGLFFSSYFYLLSGMYSGTTFRKPTDFFRVRRNLIETGLMYLKF